LIVHNSLLDQDGDSGFEKPTASEMPKPTNGIQVPNKEVVVPTASASTGSKQSKEPNPYEHFMEEAHLTALKIRQEKEAEIQRVQEHWRTQLLNLTEHVRNL
jgi:hypothetical protein